MKNPITKDMQATIYSSASAGSTSPPYAAPLAGSIKIPTTKPGQIALGWGRTRNPSIVPTSLARQLGKKV